MLKNLMKTKLELAMEKQNELVGGLKKMVSDLAENTLELADEHEKLEAVREAVIKRQDEVMDCIAENETVIKNIEKYILGKDK